MTTHQLTGHNDHDGHGHGHCHIANSGLGGTKTLYGLEPNRHKVDDDEKHGKDEADEDKDRCH